MNPLYIIIALLAVFILLCFGLVAAILLRRGPRPPMLTGKTRKTLEYVQTLLGNYYAAHQASSLTVEETEEILRLCKAEIDKVLEE